VISVFKIFLENGLLNKLRRIEFKVTKDELTQKRGEKFGYSRKSAYLCSPKQKKVVVEQMTL